MRRGAAILDGSAESGQWKVVEGTRARVRAGRSRAARASHPAADASGARFWREKSTDRLRMITLRPAGSGHVLSTPRRLELEAPPDAANAGPVQWFRSQSKYFYLKNCYMISNPYPARTELSRLKSPTGLGRQDRGSRP